jgi:hypothetical protein
LNSLSKLFKTRASYQQGMFKTFDPLYPVLTFA